MSTILSTLPFPLIQAPMAGVQGVELALAVCRAGALGSLPAAMLSPEQLATALARLNTENQGAPYNVNFFAHTVPTVTDEQRAAWLAQLQPYFTEWGLDPTAIPQHHGRQPFDEAALQLVEQYRPPVVSFHFGLPTAKLLAAVKATGAEVWSSATTVAEAQWLQAQGVDGVIAQGWEAGGHRGWFLTQDPATQSGTFALLPQIIRAVNLPVVAAGGISDATTVRAAMQLGAQAVQVGTAFLLADEAQTSLAHRAALTHVLPEHTAVTNVFSGGCARGIRNRLMCELGIINPTALPFPLSSAATAYLRATAEQHGSTDFSPFWAGQNAALAHSGSAAEIVARLATGFSQ